MEIDFALSNLSFNTRLGVDAFAGLIPDIQAF
jgi:hypothetical protein